MIPSQNLIEPKPPVPGGLPGLAVWALSGFAMGSYENLIKSFHTRIHEKQDNCLVLIAPTARWILRILVLDKKLSKLLIAPQARQELMRRLLRQTAAKGRR